MNKLKKAIYLSSVLKKWIFLFLVGFLMFIISLFVGFLNYFNRISGFVLRKSTQVFAFSLSFRALFAVLFFLASLVLMFFGAYKIYKFFAKANSDMFEKAYLEATLSKGPKIVTVGGGTGQYTLLNGLKEYSSNITAIVSTMDSGGSSQLLKTEFGVLPPGDIRNCMIALSPLEDKYRMVFNKRFKPKSSLKGHTLGNLFITRLAQDMPYLDALEIMETYLHSRGKVLPITEDKVELIAVTKDNKKYYGEADIGKNAINIKNIFLNMPAKINYPVVDALKKADVIVFGPGSLFTSVIPNLLVKGFADAVNNSKAKKIFVLNTFTEYTETHGFTMLDFVSWIENYVKLDYILVNNKKPDAEQIKRLAKEKRFYVEPITGKIGNTQIITADIINDKFAIRHDSRKLAKAIIEIIKI